MAILRKYTSSPVATADDFCACPCGVEALRWFAEGAVSPPDLLSLFDCCGGCEASTGLILYGGFEMDGGSCFFYGAFGPQPPQRTARAAVMACCYDDTDDVKSRLQPS